MTWRLPEILLLSALIVCLVEHSMVVFCYRPYLLWGVILYRKTFLAPNVTVSFPTAERLRDELGNLRRNLVVTDLSGGLFGIQASHGYCVVPLFRPFARESAVPAGHYDCHPDGTLLLVSPHLDFLGADACRSIPESGSSYRSLYCLRCSICLSSSHVLDYWRSGGACMVRAYISQPGFDGTLR